MRRLWLMAAVFLVACGERNILLENIRPARQQVTLRSQNVGVVPGRLVGVKQTDMLEILISKIEAGLIEGNRFTVVDLSSRDMRQKLIADALATSTAYTDEELLDIGKELNVALMITPSLNLDINKTQYKRQRTIQLDTGRTREKWVVNILGERVKKRVPITRQKVVSDVYEIRNVSVYGKVKLVNVETGQMISTFSLTEQLPKSEIVLEKGPLGVTVSDNEILDILVKAVDFFQDVPTEHPPLLDSLEDFLETYARRTVNEISPVSFTLPTVIYDSGDLDVGARLALAGKWQEAADKWEFIIAKEPDNAKCLHNLGAAFFVLGDLEKSSMYLTEGIGQDDNEYTISLLASVDELIQARNLAP